MGVLPLSDQQGLELIDVARVVDRGLLLPVRLDSAVLRTQARMGLLPAALSSLVRAPVRRSQDSAGSLARRLAGSPEGDWDAIVLELTLNHVAAVLGHAAVSTVDPQRAFKELGFDSLSAIELRNRLNQATGLALPATLVFDYPTPTAVARYLRSRVEGQQRSRGVMRRSPSRVDEPVVIVGMSCRYPGGVESPSGLWEFVSGEGDAVGGFPVDRGWDIERVYDPDPDHPGTSYTRSGGFLYDAGDFDAEHFSISPREAVAMDPQQRLLLEGSWEALEDAGIDPLTLKGTQTGVFAGIMYHDYGADSVSDDQTACA